VFVGNHSKGVGKKRNPMENKLKGQASRARPTKGPKEGGAHEFGDLARQARKKSEEARDWGCRLTVRKKVQDVGGRGLSKMAASGRHSAGNGFRTRWEKWARPGKKVAAVIRRYPVVGDVSSPSAPHRVGF